MPKITHDVGGDGVSSLVVVTDAAQDFALEGRQNGPWRLSSQPCALIAGSYSPERKASLCVTVLRCTVRPSWISAAWRQNTQHDRDDEQGRNITQ